MITLEAFHALEALAKRHRCPYSFCMAMRALLTPEDVLTLVNQVNATRAEGKAKITPDSVLDALKALGPGWHRVWAIQQQLGVAVGGKEGWRMKGSVAVRLAGLRKADLVVRDPDGRGWSAT